MSRLHNSWRIRAAAVLITAALAAPPANAQLVNLGSFAPGLGTLVGVAFDASTDAVWVYPDFADELRGYTREGAFVTSLPRPGESANDADIEFATESFSLGGTEVPVGTLLFVNGETGGADVYAVNTNTGFVVASLSIPFGVHHVVGGAYHPSRDSFFLVADKLDSSTPNTIAEVNPLTGDVINSFGTGSSGYTMNYGDIEISAVTGNILLVSSDESSVRELTSTGSLVRDMPLPASVGSLSGIGRDDSRSELFVSAPTAAFGVWAPRFPAISTATAPSMPRITSSGARTRSASAAIRLAITLGAPTSAKPPARPRVPLAPPGFQPSLNPHRLFFSASFASAFFGFPALGWRPIIVAEIGRSTCYSRLCHSCARSLTTGSHRVGMRPTLPIQ
jgi:hypothetical protein